MTENQIITGILITLALLFFLTNCKTKPEIQEIPEEALIVDVRTPKEFQNKHVPGAINIPLNNVQDRIDEFGEKDSQIVVYCRSGNRSGKAQKILERAGYTNVKNGGSLSAMMKMLEQK